MLTDPFQRLNLDREVLTVSQLNNRARLLLEDVFAQVWVEGEISNLAKPASGHIYFTLKDKNAQVRCALFRQNALRVRQALRDGLAVKVRGRVSLFEGRGDYQLILDNVEPAGDGSLRLAFEALKDKLSAEGLFDAAGKRALPAHPQRIGIVSSPTGAVIRDIISVFRRRAPQVALTLVPTPVQGREATAQIVRALQLADRGGFDALILARGGGSLEDLWSFNDERVARAIFASQIPVVSAVGHETDVTIADFVADLRAPTPSAAAEVVSRNQLELLRQMQYGQQRLEMAMDYFLANRTRRFTQLHHRLQQQHPQLRLARQQTVLERLRQRMNLAVDNQLKRAAQRQQRTTQRLNQHNPQPRIYRAQTRIQQLEYRLAENLRARLSSTRERFGNAVTHLEAVSPLSTLARGYSVTTTTDGNVLKQAKQVNVGDVLTTRLSDGWVESEVKGVTPVKKTRARKKA